MIQFHTFPFEKHQVIHQQDSSVTKCPHCQYKIHYKYLKVIKICHCEKLMLKNTFTEFKPVIQQLQTVTCTGSSANRPQTSFLQNTVTISA